MRVALGLVLALVAGCAAAPPSPGPFQPNRGHPAPPDPDHAIALKFAPVIYNQTSIDPALARQDVPSNIDFDGDLVGNNNWENFERFSILPTVYYSVLETETHWFLSYHLFHARDWNPRTVYLNDTHENDGENLQIVVRKRDEKPVILWAQAHYASTVAIEDKFQVVNGRSAAIFVQREGHGIYPTTHDCAELNPFEGMILQPGQYALVSTTMSLWPLLRDGKLTGDGKLLDGAWRYRDDLVDVMVPRYYDGDRTSGPLGPDRGISPFAMGRWCEGQLGELFFNPAKAYPESAVPVDEPWSRTYVRYPFR